MRQREVRPVAQQDLLAAPRERGEQRPERDACGRRSSRRRPGRTSPESVVSTVVIVDARIAGELTVVRTFARDLHTDVVVGLEQRQQLRRELRRHDSRQRVGAGEVDRRVIAPERLDAVADRALRRRVAVVAGRIEAERARRRRSATRACRRADGSARTAPAPRASAAAAGRRRCREPRRRRGGRCAAGARGRTPRPQSAGTVTASRALRSAGTGSGSATAASTSSMRSRCTVNR